MARAVSLSTQASSVRWRTRITDSLLPLQTNACNVNAAIQFGFHVLVRAALRVFALVDAVRRKRASRHTVDGGLFIIVGATGIYFVFRGE
jgi:hypothetical protein